MNAINNSRVLSGFFKNSAVSALRFMDFSTVMTLRAVSLCASGVFLTQAAGSLYEGSTIVKASVFGDDSSMNVCINGQTQTVTDSQYSTIVATRVYPERLTSNLSDNQKKVLAVASYGMFAAAMMVPATAFGRFTFLSAVKF